MPPTLPYTPAFPPSLPLFESHVLLFAYGCGRVVAISRRGCIPVTRPLTSAPGLRRTPNSTTNFDVEFPLNWSRAVWEHLSCIGIPFWDLLKNIFRQVGEFRADFQDKHSRENLRKFPGKCQVTGCGTIRCQFVLVFSPKSSITFWTNCLHCCNPKIQFV